MENIANTKQQPKKIFLITLLIGVVPLFLINILINDYSAPSIAKKLSIFFDDHLFGNIGITSSFFPFSSKISAYYTAFIAPLLCAFMFFTKKTHFTMSDFNRDYDFSLRNYLKIIIIFTVPYLFVFLLMFFLNADLPNALAKISVVGRNKYLFTLFYVLIVFPMWFYINYLALNVYYTFTAKFFMKRRELKNSRQN